MKRFLCLIFIFILVFTVTGCNKNNADKQVLEQTPQQQPTEEQPKSDTSSQEDVSKPTDTQADDKPDKAEDKSNTDTNSEKSDVSSTDSIEITKLFGKDISEVKELLGEEKSCEADDFDGGNVYDFGDSSFYANEDNKVDMILLMRDNQISDNKYTFDGITFKNTNKEVLDKLGKPVNGFNYEFIYSDDFETWLKFNFDENGKLMVVHLFVAVDQGDREFVWEEE